MSYYLKMYTCAGTLVVGVVLFLVRSGVSEECREGQLCTGFHR